MSITRANNFKNSLYLGCLFVIVALSFIWRLSVLDVFPYQYDEGIHLVLAEVLSAGYEPYRQAFVSYPPLFAWSLEFPYTWFHEAAAIQLLMSFYSILGVLAAAYLAMTYYGRLAGLAAAILVSFSPGYFIPSRAVMGEIPSVGLATLAVALMDRYRRQGGWWWAPFAGVVLSASISMKVLPIFAPVLLGLIILAKHLSFRSKRLLTASFRKNLKPLLRDAALSLLGFSLFLVWPVLLFYDILSFYDQVLGMRFASRDALSEVSFVTNGQLIVEFLSDNPAVVVLALYGLIFVGLGALRKYTFLFVWLGLSWATLFLHIPLRYKHVPLLIPPLAVWGGIGVQYVVEWFARKRWPLVDLRAAAMVLASVLAVLALQATIPESIAENQGETVEIKRYAGRENAIWRANLLTSPRDCVVVDDPVVLYTTQRLTAPELSEVSITRIQTGYLTTQQLIDGINQHGCQVVIVATERFRELLPGLDEWLSDNYLLIYDERWQDTYAVKKDTVQRPQVAIDQGFVNGIDLVGVDYTEAPLKPGERGYISFYWRLNGALDRPFKTFIHLRDQSGETLFQVDRFPFDGQLSLDRWPLSTIVKETVWFEVPESLKAGQYTLYAGLYYPEALERIPVKRDVSGENAVILGRIGIQPMDVAE